MSFLLWRFCVSKWENIFFYSEQSVDISLQSGQFLVGEMCVGGDFSLSLIAAELRILN